MKPTIRTAVLIILYALLPALLTAQSGWKPDQRLTYFQGYSYDPRAACCGDTIHLVWWEGYVDTMIHEEVYYKRSTNAGESWGADVLLTPEDSISCVSPKVAAWGSNVHIIWYEYSAYYYALCYRKSTDGGDTWSTIDTLRREIDGGWGDCWLCVQDSNIYVVFIREDSKIMFMKSTDNGVTWTIQQEIGDGSGNPRLAVFKTSSSYLCSCVRLPVSSIEVYFYRSLDAGNTWVDTQIVSENDGIGSQLPMMDTDDSSGVHITWFDYKYSPYPWTGDIFYRTSYDSGYTWEPVDSLTTQHRAVYSDILAEGNNLHLVWDDDRNGFGDNFEIYYRMSTDLGQTWGDEIRLTDASNLSRHPSLACGGQYLHLFWFDLRDDPNNIVGEIYYKRKTLTGIQETTASKFQSVGLSLYCSSILKNNSLIRYDLGDKKQGVIDLIDVTGRVIMTFPVHCNSGEFVLNFKKEVGSGVYFLILKAGNGYTIKKVSVIY